MKDSSSPSPGRVEWIAVALCLGLAVGWTFYAQKRWPNPTPAPAAATAAASATPAPTTPSPAPALSAAKAAPTKPDAPEQLAVLENDTLRATFTSHGAGIVKVELKQHAVAQGAVPVVLNDAQAAPIFALSGWDDGNGSAAYEVKQDGDHLLYTRTLPGGVRIERAYFLHPGYRIDLEQRLINPGAQPAALPALRLQVGTAQALYANDQPSYVGADWITARGDFRHILANEFAASNGVLGLFGARAARDAIASPAGSEPILWAAVKNRFFTVVLAPPADRPIAAVTARPVAGLLPGIEAAAEFAPLELQPGETRAESYALYAGPKEHAPLKALGQGEERIMEFGWWGWVAVPLTAVMQAMHQWVPNYGWVIVLLTLALKLIFWPLQSAANRSMKQMQAVGPKQKELSAKYKDDPQRMQVEVMKLYKEYGVNPVGGCLPMLIQIPIFFGFYTMLQSAGVFQHQSWLWVHDLVQPDTVGHLFGIPINPLPILMAATQFGLMKMTPQASDNPQMKVMQWMPVVMLFILYKFAAALSLYWTVNNLVSMVQTYRNLRKPVPVLTRVKKPKKPGAR